MSEHALLISVRLLDGRYNGVGDWPPSPFRLFQALVAAAHAGRTPSEDEILGLRWLENLNPPTIAIPKARQSANTTYYVPRNGADADGGDLARAAKRRDPKLSRPWLFDNAIPFVYVWTFDTKDSHAEVIPQIADLLYQFGRGVDMAFAVAEPIEVEEAEQRLSDHPGTVYRPTPNGSGNVLRCPRKKVSFDSLGKRHVAQLNRLKGGDFHQAPPPIFDTLGYDCPAGMFLFDIVANDSITELARQPLTGVAAFAEQVRDLATQRLQPHHPKLVERFIFGRNAGEADKPLRVRIVPLPSIGHAHADQEIRRLLVEVPPDCPIPVGDIDWAFSGLTLGVDPDTGAVLNDAGPILVPATDRRMLSHYGIESDRDIKARIWRTVTPAALPASQPRGKIGGRERALNEVEVAHAVRQALRHAGLNPKAEIRRIQREPFDSKGARSEVFTHRERFPADRLYHLEVVFPEPVSGPILIGDGRYLGLGLMYPVPDLSQDLIVLPVSSKNRPAITDRAEFLNAVRRALMARARDLGGFPGRLFSGHEYDGAPARSGRHDHVFLAADDADGDGLIGRLLIVAPWRADRRHHSKQEERIAFEQVSSGLGILRAGRLGIVEFGAPANLNPDDRLFRTANRWITTTPYEPTRYPKSTDDANAKVAADLAMECLRRGLPRPKVEIIHFQTGPRGGVRAHARLIFAVAILGPLMLGRDSHKGGGLFYAES